MGHKNGKVYVCCKGKGISWNSGKDFFDWDRKVINID